MFLKIYIYFKEDNEKYYYYHTMNDQETENEAKNVIKPRQMLHEIKKCELSVNIESVEKN